MNAKRKKDGSATDHNACVVWTSTAATKCDRLFMTERRAKQNV